MAAGTAPRAAHWMRTRWPAISPTRPCPALTLSRAMNIRSSANRTDRRCPLVVFSQYDSLRFFALSYPCVFPHLLLSGLVRRGGVCRRHHRPAGEPRLSERPVCPIYGFGMILVLFFLTPLEDDLLLLYLGGVILPSALELVGGWALYKLYRTRWWDYTDKPSTSAATSVLSSR